MALDQSQNGMPTTLYLSIFSWMGRSRTCVAEDQSLDGMPATLHPMSCVSGERVELSLYAF